MTSPEGRRAVQLVVRQRSARVQILQEVVDRMRQMIVARAFQYADDPVGATGMMVKDYRGKSGERAVWKFDAPLVSQMNDVLKQVTIGAVGKSRTPTHQNGCT